MLGPKSQRLTETIKRLLRRNANPQITKILAKTHPADIAAMMRFFDPREQRMLFEHSGDAARRAEVLAGLIDYEISAALLSSMPMDAAVDLLGRIPADDAADIIKAVPEELGEKLLAALKPTDSDELHGLLRYEENSAGGIMTPHYFSLPETLTTREAIERLQSDPEVEAFYVYVINDHEQLVGVISLRQLVTSRPEAKLKDIMETQVVSVSTDVHQEEVAKIVSRYDFLAVPVVDDANRLVGVITVDDVIDVLREEATIDILKMGGTSADKLGETWSLMRSVRRRVPWLAATLVGGMTTSWIISGMGTSLRQFVALAAFMPVVMGMSGNVGTQSSTITVRGIATGRIEFKQLGVLLARELGVGGVLGILYGLALGAFGALTAQNGSPISLGLVVGFAATGAMTLSAVLGTFLPLIFERLRIDPAVATNPMLTTMSDILALLIFFSIARLTL